MNCNTERFQQCRFRVINLVRNRKTRARGHVHPLAEASAIWEVAAEVEAAAQVWVTLFAKFTAAAGLRRVDRDAHACRQRVECAVERIGSCIFYNPGELMAENEWAFNSGVANPGVCVRMQIAAADPRNLDAQQNIATAGRAWAREFLHSQIRRAVEPGGQHCPSG